MGHVIRRGLAPALTLAAVALCAAPAAAQPPHTRPMPDHTRLGLHVQGMTPELREHFRAPADRGLLVTRVEPGRPAARAGLAVGDVILEAGGEPQRRSFDLVRVVARAPAGEKLPLRIVRAGRVQRIDVLPEGAALPWPDVGGLTEWLERAVESGSEELRQQLRTLERRLEELERRLDEDKEIRDGAERT